MLLLALKRPLLLGGLWLLSSPLQAQPTIVGRVTNRKAGALPGATIQLRGRIRAVTDADGRFGLPLTAADTLPVQLQIAAPGYLSRNMLSHGGTVQVELAEPRRHCGPEMFSIRRSGAVRTWSGGRHAPFGAWVELFRWRQLGRVQLPLAVALGYQTNFRSNYQLLSRLRYANPCYGRRRTLLSHAALLHSRIRTKDFRFNSYLLQGWLGRSRTPQWPQLLLGVGYAQQPEFSRRGWGATLGANGGLPRLGLQLAAHTTRWPGYWQWQAEVSRRFGRLDLALAGNAIDRRYHELNLGAGLASY